LTSLVIAAGAELEAARGAAPELLMAGHLVDAGDHQAGNVHRTAVGSHVSRLPAASPHRLGGSTAYRKLPRRCSWAPSMCGSAPG
jgi:hypothetical protein